MDNDTGMRNLTYEIDELNRHEVLKHLWILIACVIILLIGVFGNTLVLIVYKFKLKRSSARVYIISLALADLSVCLFGLPYHILDKLWILNYTNYTLCKAMTFLVVTGTFSSVFVLLVVGLDRFLKVCRPLKRQIRDFGSRKACLIAFVVAVVISIPQLFLYGNATYESASGIVEVNCFIDDDYKDTMFSTAYLGLHILIFIVSVIYLIITYGFIVKKIYEHDQMQGEIVLNEKKSFCPCGSVDNEDDGDEELDEDQAEPGSDINATEMVNLKRGNDIDTNDDDPSTSEATNANRKSCAKKKNLKKQSSCGMVRHTGGKAQEKNTRKITLMMLTITLVFILAYLPVIIISVLDVMMEDYWDGMGDFTEQLNDFLLRLYLLNNVANPVIYCFWDAKFRKECLHIIRRFLCCKSEEASSRDTSSSGYTNHTQYTLTK